MNDTICLDHCVQSERRAAFALAPAAVTTMYEQRRRFDTEADESAIAAAIERITIGAYHDRDVPPLHADSGGIPKKRCSKSHLEIPLL
jgi:hypothetical protein